MNDIQKKLVEKIIKASEMINKSNRRSANWASTRLNQLKHSERIDRIKKLLEYFENE